MLVASIRINNAAGSSDEYVLDVLERIRHAARGRPAAGEDVAL
jgi:hypothetical protein